MNLSKKTISFITIILVLIAVALGMTLLLSESKNLWVTVSWIISLIAMIPSFIYACNGYRKDVAVYYKTFMGLYALNALITLIVDITKTVGSTYSSYFSTVICAIVFIDYLILTFAKDFGKQKSMAVALCILGAQLISFIRMLISFTKINGIFVSASLNLVVAIVAFLFVYAKYQDKAERGAK